MFEYFDSHCDTMTACLDSCQELNKNICHIDLNRISFFKHYSQIFSVWIDDETRGEQASKRFLQVYDFFISQMEKYADRISFCKNKEEYEQARKQRKATAFLSIEGGQAFGGQLDNIERFYNLGVRMTTLTWNGENELGYGSMCGSKKGLTPFGKEAISQMKRLNMIIDVSHLNESGFWDVMENGGHIVASHSNSYSICKHKRNLTDKQFIALAKNGGGTGINIYTPFVHKNASLDHIIDHMEHFWSLGGEDHVFIGADYDGIDNTLPELKDVIGMEKLYNRLLQKNYPESLLHKLFYQNLEAIMLQVL
jgi:membrane dipeptidase